MGGIRTKALIAEVFAALVTVLWLFSCAVFVGLFAVGGMFSVGTCTENGEVVPCSQLGGVFAGIGMAFGIFFLILALVSLLVVRRANSMRTAAIRGDVMRLKHLRSTGWAVLALLFTGVIPGILFFLVDGQIDELSGLQA